MSDDKKNVKFMVVNDGYRQRFVDPNLEFMVRDPQKTQTWVRATYVYCGLNQGYTRYKHLLVRINDNDDVTLQDVYGSMANHKIYRPPDLAEAYHYFAGYCGARMGIPKRGVVAICRDTWPSEYVLIHTQSHDGHDCCVFLEKGQNVQLKGDYELLVVIRDE